MKLQDKVVIVTGAASGIGRAIALALGLEGACMVIGDVDLAEGEKVVIEKPGHVELRQEGIIKITK